MNLQKMIAKLKELRPDLAAKLTASPTLEEVATLLAEAMEKKPKSSREAGELTEDELRALIADTAKEAVGPAIKSEMAEALKPQGGIATAISNALKASEPAEFDQKVLGKHPYGRKALALALACLEGVPVEDVEAVGKLCKKHWKIGPAESIAKWATYIKTTVAAGNASVAGDMVFPEQDPEWIELLRNNAVVRNIARTIPMPRGATVRRKQTGAATAAYQGELGPTAPSNLQVGRATLSYKKLRALTVVSNDIIRFAGGEADRMVQEDLLRVTALREDRAFLVGNPPVDSGSPQGIRFQTIGTQVAAAAGVTLANFQADLTDSIADVQDSNVPASPQNSYFIVSPRLFWTLYALATTTGDMIFAAMLAAAQPRIFGFPVLISTQLSIANTWIGANGGMSMFVYAPGLEIHDSLARTVEAFRGGAYRDENNTVQSGISNDETVITCTAEHDFLQVFPSGASIKTGYNV